MRQTPTPNPAIERTCPGKPGHASHLHVRHLVFTEIKSTSPDGRFQVRVEAWEARNSLWIESPAIYDARSEEIILKFQSEMWSLDKAEWKTGEVVDLTLRKYPGNHTPSQLLAAVNCQRQTAELRPLPAVSLAELERLLENQLTWK